MSRENPPRRWPLRQSGLPQSPSKFLCCSRAIGPEPACFRLEKNCQIAAGGGGGWGFWVVFFSVAFVGFVGGGVLIRCGGFLRQAGGGGGYSARSVWVGEWG